jgi:hypothetical protein
MTDYDLVCLVLKATTISLTDIITVSRSPKNWTVKNVNFMHPFKHFT